MLAIKLHSCPSDFRGIINSHIVLQNLLQSPPSSNICQNISTKSIPSPQQPKPRVTSFQPLQRFNLIFNLQDYKNTLPGSYDLQPYPWPQQFRYMTWRRDSSDCLLWSPPGAPPISELITAESGRTSVASGTRPPEPPEKKRFLRWLMDLRPDLSFWPPWSEWLLTTATLVAIHSLLM